MTEDQYRAQYHEDDAVGWDAINAALETLYGDREPRHSAASSNTPSAAKTRWTAPASTTATNKPSTATSSPTA